jgi:hypothetical protein
MKYSFHPTARVEFLEAIEYYERYQAGLGVEFAKEVFATIQRIIHFPKAWMKLSENTRRCLTYRFPYGVIYQVTGGEIFIIAIMQLNREPDYWKKRKK